MLNKSNKFRGGIMKNKITIISIFMFFSILAGLFFGQNNPQWKGKIEYENGVKVIKNPNEPLYGEITFELEEDLSIGNEDDENYVFYGGASINIDSEGNIFVSDRRNFRIQKYDKDGNYLQTIGRKGQGPGEFERSCTAFFDSKDNFYVRDGMRIHMFEKNGKLKRTFTIHNLISAFRCTEEGKVFANVIKSAPGAKGMNTINEFALLDSEWKIIKTFGSYSETYEMGGAQNLGHAYTPGIHFSHLDNEHAIYGISSEFRLIIVNFSGDTVRIIEKNTPPRSLTKKEKNEIINDAVEQFKQISRGQKYSKSDYEKSTTFPKYVYYFSGIKTDDQGRIYTGGFISPFEEKKTPDWDLFNKEGYYLYRAKIPVYPRVIKNGYIYRSETDPETGYIKIKRYKIKNWDKIKTGI